MVGTSWAIVLAGGEGTRLRPLTTNRNGVAVPKQFCSFDGPASLLRQAVDRASRVVPRERVAAVVAREHRRWWAPELADLRPENVLVQPQGRGTAPGVLFPALVAAGRDPQATLLVLPADHHVDDEAILARTLRSALEQARALPDAAILVGITPDAPDCGYGWIIPGREERGVRRVARFVEKPDRATAARLFVGGGLWSSFIFCAQAQALLALFESALPGMVERFRAALAGEGIDRLYARLEPCDFSRDVLEPNTAHLRVRAAPQRTGWSDLGTPERVAAVIARRPRLQRPRPLLLGPLGLIPDLSLAGAVAAG